MQLLAKGRNQKMARLKNTDHTQSGIHRGSTVVAK